MVPLLVMVVVVGMDVCVWTVRLWLFILLCLPISLGIFLPKSRWIIPVTIDFAVILFIWNWLLIRKINEEEPNVNWNKIMKDSNLQVWIKRPGIDDLVYHSVDNMETDMENNRIILRYRKTDKNLDMVMIDLTPGYIIKTKRTKI